MAKAKATTAKTAAKSTAKASAKPAGEKAGSKMLKATLMKSPIGALPQIRATVQSLGFRRMQQTRELPDNDAVRGMLKAVNFLVAVEGEPYLRPKRGRYKIWRSRSNKKHQRGN
jgi:large subunit ribosomal protein L30